MPKKLGPERSHFGGEHGLITEIIGGATKYYWRCEFCNWEMGDKSFANAKARIHLSGDPKLKNDQIANVCEKAPDNIKEQFAALERSKRVEKKQKDITRKRGIELMNGDRSSPVITKRKKSKQITLPFASSQTLSDREVDNAWGMACFGLDLAANKFNDPLFRDALHATQNSSKRLLLIYHLFLFNNYQKLFFLFRKFIMYLHT